MNLVKEFLLLKAKVDKLYCQLIANTSAEQNSSVPNHVKNIKQEDIDNWNKVEDAEVQITEDTYFTEIGQNQKDFNKNVSDYKVILDNKNIEQDGRIENLEGVNYIWSPTNRTLTLFDKEGNQLSQVSLVSLDDEGTSLKYNDITLSLELYNEADELLTSIPVSAFIGSVGTQLHLSTNQLQLKDSQGNILSTVNFQIDDKTTDIVIATTTVGAINAGETVPAGTTIQGLTELLLDKTFYPTFVDPTFSLTNNSINSPKEVGSLANIILTFNFNRGKILGKLVNGIWDEDEQQDYRAGEATSYSLNGVSSNPATVNVLTVLGTNPLNGSVTYGIGVQPKDSKGDDFESRFPDGTSPLQSTAFEGIYPYFYYKSTSPITPAIMQSAIANGQAIKVVERSTGTITVPFLPSGEYIAVAYPATSATKKKWYVTPLDNGDIKPGSILGNETVLPCNSPTGLWNGINFKIHVSPGVLTQYEAVQLKNS